MGPLDSYLPYLLNRAGARIATAFNDEVRPLGATLQIWRVLAALREQDGRRMGDLSDTTSIERIHELFGDILDGYATHANNSQWISFTTVRNERWHHDNVILLGDAAHTAHFSIGSGTKLAMEDAVTLAACLHEEPSVDAALKA